MVNQPGVVGIGNVSKLQCTREGSATRMQRADIYSGAPDLRASIIREDGLDPFRAPKPLPILNLSKFVPKRVSSDKGVKIGQIGLSCLVMPILNLYRT